jgi:hypothetical protein
VAVDSSPAASEFLDRLAPMEPGSRRVQSQPPAVQALRQTSLADWLAAAIPAEDDLT